MNDDIQRLLAERSLVREAFDDAQVLGFWTKARYSESDARSSGISAEGAFQLAYTSVLQATLATLAAHGLRVRSAASHYKAFYALQKLEPTLARHAVRFDELRSVRHEVIYEPEDEDEMTERLNDALALIADAFPSLRSSIASVRPELRGKLA